MRHAFLISAALCAAAAPAQLPAGFSDTVVASGLNLPSGFGFAPDGRIFVLEKGGVVRIIKNGALLPTPFATISLDSTFGRGLLGIAFDPNFATNHFVYLYYTAGLTSFNPPLLPKSRVSRFVADGDMVVPGSETIILDGIASDSGSDNGGTLKFGIDGKLYISTGDGGLFLDLSQNLNDLAGKILRINPDGTIPADNPFVGQPNTRGEVWAYGLRNPFRFTFRPGTNVPIIADVGEATWEEINVGAPGANFGWPLAEGVGGASLVNPAFTYNHFGAHMCVIGGVFGKSARFPASFGGRYFYADYKLNMLYYLDMDGNNRVVNQATFGPTGNGPVDFAIGPDGALYYVAILEKTVRKITYAPTVATLTLPAEMDGGTTLTGTFELNAPAAIGGQAVLLTSNSPATASVPAKITLASGQTQGAFTLSAPAVTAEKSVTITANAFGTASPKTHTLVIKPNGIKGLYLSASSVVGGNPVTATVGLNSPARQATSIAISGSPSLAPPDSVAIASGAVSKTFSVPTLGVAVITTATLRANWAGTEKTKSITISPAALTSLAITPNPIQGGTAGTGAVTLNGAAPTGGAPVAVTDNTSLITTPTTMTVPAGASTGTFGFTTSPVSVSAARTITVTYKGVSKTVTVNLIK